MLPSVPVSIALLSLLVAVIALAYSRPGLARAALVCGLVACAFIIALG